MNKTVNCNLAGIVFHMDEDAYAKLHQYLLTIRKYFSGSEGQEEILADIEARFAELFQEKLKAEQQVVSMADVNQAIEVMGQPEAYLDEDEGIGSAESAPRSSSKRMFRDPDHSYIGGVCGGLGAYFGIDPVIFRLIFLALFFGAGTGLVLYIILWIILPEAKTAAEKLEMRGKPVTASNIGKVISEEFEDVRSRVGKQASKFKQSGGQNKFKDGLDDLLEGFFAILGFVLKFALKLFGFAMILLGVVIIIGLLSGFFGFGFILFPYIDHHPLYGLEYETLSSMFFVAESQLTWILIGIGMFGAVPVMHLLYLGIRMLFKLDPMPKVLNASLATIWVISLIILASNVVSIALDFRSSGNHIKEYTLEAKPDQVILLDIGEDMFSLSEYDIYFDENHNLLCDDVELDIKRSYSNDVVLRVRTEAQGRDKRTAYYYAKDVSYEYEQQDSIIRFNDFLSINRGDKWRAQKVELDLLIPLGQEIHLGENLTKIIYDIDNVHNMWDNDMVNHIWRMQSTGLTCIDCIDTDF